MGKEMKLTAAQMPTAFGRSRGEEHRQGGHGHHDERGAGEAQQHPGARNSAGVLETAQAAEARPKRSSARP